MFTGRAGLCFFTSRKNNKQSKGVRTHISAGGRGTGGVGNAHFAVHAAVGTGPRMPPPALGTHILPHTPPSALGMHISLVDRYFAHPPIEKNKTERRT